MTSSALQSRKWQLTGMSQWCRSALCGHSLPALTDSWTYGAASRHTIAPISHTRPLSHSRSYCSFPVLLRVGGWVGQSTRLATCSRLLAVDRVWVEHATSRLRVRYSSTTPLHPLYVQWDFVTLFTDFIDADWLYGELRVLLSFAGLSVCICAHLIH